MAVTGRLVVWQRPGGASAGREEGELLWPRRCVEAALTEIRADLADERTWSAHYPQEPVPDGGAIWLREWFKQRYNWTQAQVAPRWDRLAQPRRDLGVVRIIHTIDCANKKGSTDDYSVIASLQHMI